MKERIFLSPPDVGEEEEQAVLRAMRSGWVAPLGPEVDEFEAEMSERIGVAHSVALNSGTSALHLGLLALGVGQGDVVITSTMTFAATANAICYTGAKPYFVDCLPDTANIDPYLLAESIRLLRLQGRNVAAIVPVDMLGKAVNYTEVEEVARQYGVPVLADAAESLGASHNGRPVGSFGKASIFSFNGNKIMTTSGGGMLLTDCDEIARKVRYLGAQARQPVSHYEHVDIGYNYRLSNVLAAIGRAQLCRLDSMIEKRKHLRAKYKNLFEGVPGVRVFGEQNDDADNAWLTSIQVNSDSTGWSLREFTREMSNRNIETRVIWKPMHLQPVFSGCEGNITGVAEDLFKTCITLPSGSALTQSQQERVFEEIIRFIEAN